MNEFWNKAGDFVKEHPMLITVLLATLGGLVVGWMLHG